MRVIFDLRPVDMVEKERKKTGFNLTRLVALILMMAFFITCIGYIFTATVNMFYLRDRIEIRQGAVTVLQREVADLRGQVNDRTARERVYANALRIMNEDLPTIEVLVALERHMDEYGIGFETLRFVTPTAGRGAAATAVISVEVTGQAISDRKIIEFSERLSTAGVFSNVFVPSTRLNENTGMISFTLRMPIYSIGEITIP